MRLTARGLALAALLVIASATVHAQLFRAYLSEDGLDTNPCTLPQPCRLLPAAIAAVGSGGEIWMLDSANYNTGTVTIDKSVTILAVPGVLGSVVTLGGPAILVSLGGLEVTLRNINISPFPGHGGQNGIDLTGAGSTITLDGCRLRNVNVALRLTTTGRAAVVGTLFESNVGGVSLSNGAIATITDSTVVGNTTGITLSTNAAGATTYATIARTLIAAHNNIGLLVIGQGVSAVSRAFVQDSQVVNNNIGARAFGLTGSAYIHFNQATIAGNGVGIESDGTALVGLQASALTHNGTGYSLDTGGVLETSQNNAIRHNGAPVGALTPVGTQ